MHRRTFIARSAATAVSASVATLHTASRAMETPLPASLDDVAIIRSAMTLHAGLYRYNSPRQIAARLDRLEGEWNAQRALDQRYLALSRFLSALQCGHSYCNFFNQRAEPVKALFDRGSRLPFAFRWIDRSMVVTGDSGGVSGLPRGTVVDRLNGERPADLLAALLPYARADGGNDGKRIAIMEMRGQDRLESFDIFHGLLRGAPAGGVHRLSVTLPGGQRAVRDVPAISLSARQAATPVDDKVGPAWQWAMDDVGIATLNMPGWALYNSKWDWQSWLDDRLTSLSGAKGLIVDLRENEGGLDCGNRILDRLTDRDLTFAAYDRCVRYQRTPAAIDRYLDTWDDSFRVVEPDAVPIAGGYYRLPRETGVDVLPVRGPRVTVPVAVLIGPTNSSATFQFASRCRQSGLARLFGQTTGGNRRGINGGRFFFVRLPDSGIEFDLPLIATLPATPQPDAGVEPHVKVRTRASDIANGRDPDMLAARAWLTRA